MAAIPRAGAKSRRTRSRVSLTALAGEHKADPMANRSGRGQPQRRQVVCGDPGKLVRKSETGSPLPEPHPRRCLKPSLRGGVPKMPAPIPVDPRGLGPRSNRVEQGRRRAEGEVPASGLSGIHLEIKAPEFPPTPSMKALQYDHPGLPREALKLRELPLPAPGPGALRQGRGPEPVPAHPLFRW
jgi:hypothetical protein